MDLGNFDVNNVELTDFGLIPKGQYKAILIASDNKTTKNGNGSYIKCEFEIIDGNFKGRKLWHNITWENPNEIAVNIGRQTLARICNTVAPGKEVRQTEELHNKPLLITVAVQEQNGEDRNKLTYFSSIEKSSSKKKETAPWKEPEGENDVPY